MSITIVGFSSSVKLPGFFGETVYNAGPVTAADIPLRLLLCGTKISAGSATPNQDVNQILSQTDADTLYGAGSELAVMCRGALQIPGVSIYGAPVPEAGGAVAASATITITGSWSTAGTYSFRVDGVGFSVVALSTDTISTFADTVAAAVNSVSACSCTAAKGSSPGFVVTLTRKSAGARGNQGILFQDISGVPSGMSVAIAGGTSITGGGVHFGSGTGVDDVTTLLASVIQAQQYDRIAFAQNDATNAARWHTFLNNQAAPLIGFLQHGVCAVNSSFSSATSLAQTTLNAERVQILWQNNGETIPSFVAATFGAYRTLIEQDDPGAAYDGYILPGVIAQSQQADWPSTNTLIAALNSGVTPITTNRTGSSYIVRSITTHSQDSSGNPQYTTLDTSDAVVPDYVRTWLRVYWTTVFHPANPKVADDPPTPQRARPAGVATPTGWRRSATQQLKVLESNLILTDVDTHPVIAEYNTVARRIMSIVPVVPTANDHQVGVSIRSMAA